MSQMPWRADGRNAGSRVQDRSRRRRPSLVVDRAEQPELVSEPPERGRQDGDRLPCQFARREAVDEGDKQRDDEDDRQEQR